MPRQTERDWREYGYPGERRRWGAMRYQGEARYARAKARLLWAALGVAALAVIGLAALLLMIVR